MRYSSILALAASVSTTLAVSQGFNYGSTNSDGSFRYQADFEREFKLAKNLVGTSGFNSARLYTMIQGGSSTNEPIQAIPAAIAQKTTLLLGLWASGGDGFLQAEITALKSAIGQWGSAFTDLVVGISVGSEDLYRISPTGIAAKSGYGAEPQTVANYIGQVREALQGTPLSGAPVGHVDTWTAWVNGSNQAVINACDWIGVDAYPYFQNTQSNSIENGKPLFEQALADTQGAVGGKEIWITETGWPVSGATQNLAVPSTQNAKTYWDEVGCPRFGKVNTWWFTLQDATPTTPNPSFGIVGSGSDKPLFDLSCNGASSSSSSSSRAPASSTSTPSSTGGSGGSGGSGSGSSAPPSAPPSSAHSTSTPSAIPSTPSSTSASPSNAEPSTESSASSIAFSESSAASSVASFIASEPVVSSGGGLSPTQGGGISVPVNSSGGTGSPTSASGPFPTGASGNSSVTAGQPSTALTTDTTVIQGSGASVSPSSSGPATVDNGNGATVISGSLFGAIGALCAAFVAL